MGRNGIPTAGLPIRPTTFPQLFEKIPLLSLLIIRVTLDNGNTYSPLSNHASRLWFHRRPRLLRLLARSHDPHPVLREDFAAQYEEQDCPLGDQRDRCRQPHADLNLIAADQQAGYRRSRPVEAGESTLVTPPRWNRPIYVLGENEALMLSM